MQGERRFHNTLPFIICIIITCSACFFGMIYASNQASQEAGKEMSTFYLRELTSQTIGHFQTSLRAQFSQLKTAVSAVAKKDLQDKESLQKFLTQVEAENNFSFLAFLDDQGDLPQYRRCLSGGIKDQLPGRTFRR